MPYPLEFLDCSIDNSNFDGAENAVIGTLSIGGGGEIGDKRVCVIIGSSAYTLSNVSAGWTVSSAISLTGSWQAYVVTQVISDTSTDGTFTGSHTGGAGCYVWNFTLRNWSPAQVWSASTLTGIATASGTTPTNVNNPSVTVAAGSVHLRMDIAITATSKYYTKVYTPPAGYTRLCDDAITTSGSNDWDFSFDAKTYSSAGSTGITGGNFSVIYNAVSTGIAITYITFSLVLAQNPDIASALTPPGESDAGVAVTSSLLSSVTNAITPAQEVDTALEVYNPLRAVSIRPPALLTGNPVTASRVSWSAATPAAGSAVLVETSLDGGTSWQTATNGAAVPGLVRGDTTTSVVLTRATMTRLLSTDTSPYFISLRTEVSVDTSYNELVPLGLFLITQVDITETGGPSGTGSSGGGSGNGVTGSGGSSTGGGLALTVSGIDLSYAISRNTWTEIYYVPSNTNYATAALEIAQNRLPGITSDVSSTEVTAERLLFGTNQGSDAWQDLQDMGTAIGYEAHFDPIGTFKFKAITDPALTPSVWTVSDAANPTMVSYTRSISDSTTYNYVVVSGESTSNAVPVSAVAFDADPSSPTYYLGPYNIVTTTFVSAMITTPEQAQQAADALLLVVKGASETVQITMVPNPALEPDDIITVTRTFNGQPIIQGTFKINSISMPLAQSGAQVLVCYRQSAAQG